MTSGPEDRNTGDPEELDLFSSDSIEESLSEALNDLEKILEGPNPPTYVPAEHPPHQTTDDFADASEDTHEPHAIPLLNDVVIPGISMTSSSTPPDSDAAVQSIPGNLDRAALLKQLTGAGAEHNPEEPAEFEMDAAALRRRLADRLASEVEVLLQARLEDALKDVCDDLRKQVRNHIDIVLPEIVDEMLQHRHGHDG